jgi:Icc-related predicted phosphoesterase
MKILIFSDIHDDRRAFEKLKRHLSKHRYDLVLTAGDFTYQKDRGLKFVNDILTYFHDTDTPFFGIPGNNDTQSILDALSAQNMSIHMSKKNFMGWSFYGIGGMGDPDEFRLDVPELVRVDKKTIFVSHIPPSIKSLDRVKFMPFVHISGHIHSSEKDFVIKGCKYIRVPSIMNHKVVILSLPSREVQYINLDTVGNQSSI